MQCLWGSIYLGKFPRTPGFGGGTISGGGADFFCEGGGQIKIFENYAPISWPNNMIFSCCLTKLQELKPRHGAKMVRFELKFTFEKISNIRF